jgi:hypothetical protein
MVKKECKEMQIKDGSGMRKKKNRAMKLKNISIICPIDYNQSRTEYNIPFQRNKCKLARSEKSDERYNPSVRCYHQRIEQILILRMH